MVERSQDKLYATTLQTIGAVAKLPVVRVDREAFLRKHFADSPHLNAILKSEGKLRGVIKTELTELRDKYGDDRRTRLTADTGEIDVLDLIEDEEVVVVLTKKGYIKTVPADQFRRQGRGGKGVRGSRQRHSTRS